VFPNCTAKPKGERQLYVADALLEARELGGMVVRRPHDRVSHSSSSIQQQQPAAVAASSSSSQQQQQQQASYHAWLKDCPQCLLNLLLL
jgi:hypothetical protein